MASLILNDLDKKGHPKTALSKSFKIKETISSQFKSGSVAQMGFEPYQQGHHPSSQKRKVPPQSGCLV